jgi:L-ribulokinase
MAGKIENAYPPDPRAAEVYDQLYAEYVLLHDYFGRGANEVMHRLRALRDRVLGEAENSQQAEEKDHDKPVGAEK